MYCFNIVNEILVVISIGYKPVTTAPQMGVYTPSRENMANGINTRK